VRRSFSDASNVDSDYSDDSPALKKVKYSARIQVTPREKAYIIGDSGNFLMEIQQNYNVTVVPDRSDNVVLISGEKSNVDTCKAFIAKKLNKLKMRDETGIPARHQICKYFLSPGGCSKENTCTYLHINLNLEKNITTAYKSLDRRTSGIEQLMQLNPKPSPLFDFTDLSS